MLPRRVWTNSGWSLAGTGLPLLVLIATVPLYLEQIGAARYGALAIAWLLVTYFAQADFGLGRAVTRRLAALSDEQGSERASVVASAAAACLGIGVVAAIALYIVGDLFVTRFFEVDDELRRELGSALVLIALSAPIVALANLASGVLMGSGRFQASAVGNMLGSIMLQVLPLIVAFALSSHLTMLIWASLLARIVQLMILWGSMQRQIFLMQEFSASRKEAAHLLGYGKWIMISALVGPLMIVLDRFLIGALLGAVAVAAYTIPFQITSRTMLLPGALVQALYPEFSESEGKAETVSERASLRITAFLFAPVAVALICLAEPLLKLWLGDSLDERSITVARIVMAGFWINAVAAISFTKMQASGDAQFVAKLHLAELPFYLIALYLLGQEYGLAGMAAAFALRCAVDAAVLLRRSAAADRQEIVLIALAGVPVITALAWSPAGWFISSIAAILLLGAAAASASWNLREFTMPIRA